MPIAPFKLERYYARYEFNTRIMLSSSDCESLFLSDLLEMASAESRVLWDNLKLGYTETQGHPALRQEASRIYTGMQPQNLLVAAPEELIYIAMQTFLEPGDHIIALSPAYQSLYEVARSIGCAVSFWPLRVEGTCWVLDLDELERLVNPHTRLLVLNIPNNPTGFLPSKAELDAIIQFARRHGLTVFSDEMYRLLEYRPEDQLPAMCDVYEKGVSLSGLSKTMALPGLRIGWLASREAALMEKWMAFKDYTTICNSAPSEVLGIIALQNREKLVARSLTIIQENLQIANGFFERHASQFNWLPPRAGSIAFPRWLGVKPVEQLTRELVEQFSVMLVPGTLFDHPGSHFRLGLGRRNFPEGMASLEKYLAD